MLNESNIGGHDYLRNLVHLPFFLQNAALRKVKHVKMLESSIKRGSRLLEDDGVPSLMVNLSVKMHSCILLLIIVISIIK